MIIKREEEYKLIEVIPNEGYLLKDESDCIMEGLCMKDDGQSDEEIKALYNEISIEEAKKYIEEI